jgi:DNA processing protein
MNPAELSERQAFMILNDLPNIGPITLNRLLADFDGSRRQLEAVRGVGSETSAAVAAWQTHFDIAREETKLSQADATFLIPQDSAYPRLLKEIHDPPIGLYRKGSYDFEQPCVAIVGSRRTTLYGTTLARKFAAELVRLGFCVVSGLARGIDTAAHEGALEAGGKTVAVVSTGIDIIYPSENLRLYRRIAESGAVLSEFPFGRKADRQTFAMRNRIVSGMSEAIIVVESDVDGGAMITAKFAGEQGRLLFAVPGRIDQSTSAGCHQLIRDGATLLTSIDDLLGELSYLDGLRPAAIGSPAPRATVLEQVTAQLDEPPRLVLEQFRGGGILGVDAIAELTRFAAPEVSAALMMLELKKLVQKRADGRYEAK